MVIFGQIHLISFTYENDRLLLGVSEEIWGNIKNQYFEIPKFTSPFDFVGLWLGLENNFDLKLF